KWQNKHPYWTGVWDTSDDARPPSWLVSGQFQLRSLAKKTAYEGDLYKTPWVAVPKPNPTEYVTLLSSLPSAIENSAEHPFDTRVIAPLVPILSPDKTPLGNFAYYVADEGVKGRLNLHDAFARKTPDSVFSHSRVLAPARAAAELFPRWESLKTDDKLHAGYVINTAGYANLPKLSHIFAGLNNTNPANTYSHAVTAYSQGVLSDVRHGGLKHDLSLLFELPSETFRTKTVYGVGLNGKDPTHNNGTGTLNMTATTGHGSGDGSVKDLKWDPQLEPMTLVDNRARILSRPVFNVSFGGKNIRGPAWELMRNYYRLYKEGDDDIRESPGWPNFVDGALRARTFYPGITAHRNFNGEAISHIFNSQNAGGDDVFAQDFWKGGSPIPRVTKIATPAYMARYILGFGLQKTSDGTLRLILIPIVGIRNPFNVPLRLVGNGVEAEGKSGRVAIRCALRKYASTTFTFILDGGTTTPTISMDDLFARQGVNYGGGGSLAIYIPADITIPPGETWVFSPSDRDVAVLTKSLIAERGFNQLGGFYLDRLNNGQPLNIKENSSIRVRIGYNPSGGSYNSGTFIREQISSWPNDQHIPGGSVDDNCGEHSEPFMILFDPAVAFDDTPEDWGSGILYSVEYPVSNIPENGSIPVGITEFLEKPAGAEFKTPFPLYAMSNPLTSTKRPDAQVRWAARGTQYGFKSTTPSWHFRLRKATSWEELLEVSGYSAYGGNSITSKGQTKFISAHIPRAPMVTLGQFQSACLSVVDHQPLYSVGHSFATPFVKPDSVYYTANNWTRYDHTWLLNATLWDKFYFSTIAPEVDPSGSGVPVVKRQQYQVWNDFLDGKEPLINQQFVFSQTADKANAKKLLETNHSYRQSAGFLLQNGTFNINATDERAWRTVLGSTHETPVPTMNNNSGVWSGVEKTDDTPFPRFIPIVGSSGNGGLKNNSGIADAASWKGGKALNSTQIEKLARAIALKIRTRLATLGYRTKYSSPTGETLCRPFFSLAEFINRSLTNDETGKIGLVQSAIFYADSKLGAAINTGMKQSHDLTPASLRKADQGAFYAPEIAEISDGNILMASGAPGALLQGDILQIIGSKISPRSDTFVIRAYGDTASKAGTHIAARAYIEAVVQRLPDYVDPSNKNTPDLHPDKDAWDPNDRKINPINIYLGRRFRVISTRWLAGNEI
ncbi:MAG: hypothetical protein LBS59_05030, partial [Puniceicoccales bacterium]|nr:hypothetical protein [Puniceicoccales bacterium]